MGYSCANNAGGRGKRAAIRNTAIAIPNAARDEHLLVIPSTLVIPSALVILSAAKDLGA